MVNVANCRPKLASLCCGCFSCCVEIVRLSSGLRLRNFLRPPGALSATKQRLLAFAHPAFSDRKNKSKVLYHDEPPPHVYVCSLFRLQQVALSRAANWFESKHTTMVPMTECLCVACSRSRSGSESGLGVWARVRAEARERRQARGVKSEPR